MSTLHSEVPVFEMDPLVVLETEVHVLSQSVQSGAPVVLPPIRKNARFQRLYRYKPHSFVYDCVNWPAGKQLTPYQYEILEELPIKKRMAVRGPHGLGKTALVALIILWFGLTRDGDDWKCPTTASAWRQLTKFLWPEVHKWARLLRWDKVGRAPFNMREELQQTSLKLDTGEAFAAASDNPGLIEGAHADSLLFVYDEAKIIPGETFDATEGAFSNADVDPNTEAYALAVSTPGEPVGRFYDINKHKPGYEDWHVRHVTLQEAIDAKRISPKWAEQRKKQWGEQSAVYQNRVLGEFCASDEDGVIPLSWIEAANRRWEELNDAFKEGRLLRPMLTQVGLDVGAGKMQDKTSFARRYENFVDHLIRNDNENTMQTTGRLVGMLRATGAKGVVDSIGIGLGVLERAREQGYNVVGFNAQAGTTAKDHSGEMMFVNCRSAAWWRLREKLDPTNDPDLALPPDDLLTGDLTAPHWRQTSNGRIEVEGKDSTWANENGQTMRQRLGRSTDDGDSTVMCVWDDKSGETHIALGGQQQGDGTPLQAIFGQPNGSNGHSNGASE